MLFGKILGAAGACFIVSVVWISATQYAFAGQGQDGAQASETSSAQSNTKVRGQRSPLFPALESALKNNKEILAAQRELMALHENIVSASAAFRPKVSLNSQYQAGNKRDWQSFKGGLPSTNSKAFTKSYGLGVKQNLFHGFADVAALRETDLSTRAKWSEYENKKQTVLRNIAVTYFAIIAKQEEINHLKSLLDARRESIEVAKEMHETGTTKYLDVAQANAGFSDTEAKLAKADSEYIAYRSQFEELTGFTLPEKLIAPEKLFDERMTEAQATDLALKNNPGVIAATDILNAAKAAVKKVNPEFVPSVDFSYSWDQSYNHSRKNLNSTENKRNSKGNTVGLSVSVPIYDGGSARAERRKYVEAATKAAVEREKTIEELKTQIVAVWASLRAAKQSLVSAKIAVEARALALHDTEEEYKAGVKIMKDVLDAQEKLFEARFMEIQAENDYFSNQCRANALIGRMNARYLKIADSDFSYRAHYDETKRKF